MVKTTLEMPRDTGGKMAALAELGIGHRVLVPHSGDMPEAREGHILADLCLTWHTFAGRMLATV